MDQKLVAWARAVKARRRRAGLPDIPPLWLFTDARRVPDPRPAIARLPRGLCGVVLRHDRAPGRAALARAVARLCRERRLALSVAGDWRLAASVRAAVHLRDGRGRDGRERGAWQVATGLRPLGRGVRATSSAHSIVDARRAARAGAALIFVSPWRATLSHPDGRALGTVRWLRIAAHCRPDLPMVLGGVDGRRLRSLGRAASGAGAIGGLS